MEQAAQATQSKKRDTDKAARETPQIATVRGLCQATNQPREIKEGDGLRTLPGSLRQSLRWGYQSHLIEKATDQLASFDTQVLTDYLPPDTIIGPVTKMTTWKSPIGRHYLFTQVEIPLALMEEAIQWEQ